MVDWGIKHPSEATDALIHLIGELREVSRFGACERAHTPPHPAAAFPGRR